MTSRKWRTPKNLSEYQETIKNNIYQQSRKDNIDEMYPTLANALKQA